MNEPHDLNRTVDLPSDPAEASALPQTLPGSRQELPLPQSPNSWLALSFTHSNGPTSGWGLPDQPQQSLSARHRSPVTWQPDAGWHTFVWVAP